MIATLVSVGGSLTAFTVTEACTGVGDSRPPSSRATAVNAASTPFALAAGVQ